MTELDLRSPLELERAEQSCAAAGRAIAHRSDLRFRGHLVHLGHRLSPARAPYVNPSVDAQDLGDLRGSVDAAALRVLHSDESVYREFLPQGDFAGLVYEFLEQFRVEALAPVQMPGVGSNVRHLFLDWSAAFEGEGLLESDVGLLVFTVVHMCRSRVMAEPIPDEVNDHTEATRAGFYQVLGPGLASLRSHIGDQRAFAPLARDFAERVGAFIEDAMDADSDRPARSSILAMLADNSDRDTGERTRHDDELADGRALTSDEYAIFTGEFDRELPVGELLLPHALRTTRVDLDELEARHGRLGAYLTRGVQSLFPVPLDPAWQSEQEEGRLDPRLLTRLVTGSLDARVFRQESLLDSPRAAVTFLVDCSGSMKAVIPEVAALVDLFARALDRVDVATEVLGFTTGGWSGGRAHRDWMAAGRPAHPGRLNERDHIVFKDFDTSWRRARSAISGLLWTPIFREGLDGEALEWAYARLSAQQVSRRHLILICDGSPMDSATSLANGEEYLDRHLIEVAEEIEAQGKVSLFGLGIGHDMSTFLTESRIVDPERILDREVARTLLEALAR